MNHRKLSGHSLEKVFSLVQVAPSWNSTIEFMNFYEAMRKSDKGLEVFWEDDFIFFLEASSSGRNYIHGIFRDWKSLLMLKNFIQKRAFIGLNSKPPFDDLSCHEGVVLQRKGKSDCSPEAGPQVTLEEILSLIEKRSPEFLNGWFINDLQESLTAKTYHCRKDSSGQILYLHLMRPVRNLFHGVYVTSTLPFPETLKEFHAAHSIAGAMEVRAVVLRDNEASMQLHKLLGYEETDKRNYYCEF